MDGFGIPTEAGGRFVFEQPPAGQAIFSASRKTSKLFELKEGERLQFKVDLVQGGAKDSFAVLAFIPQANDTSTLGGYGFAKSTTDILITKGVNKYFYNEDPPTPIKNDNITLSLTLTARQGSVSIDAEALDKDAGDAVIFRQSALDTPGPMSLGMAPTARPRPTSRRGISFFTCTRISMPGLRRPVSGDVRQCRGLRLPRSA